MKTFNKLLLLNYKSKTLKLYLNLGSKLYYMNKDGGLSFFDVASNQVTEVLDNTTFVSIIKFLFHYFFPEIRIQVKEYYGSYSLQQVSWMFAYRKESKLK